MNTVVLDEALDDKTFAGAYDRHVPTLDGRRATKFDVRFSGSGSLDSTSDDDLQLLEAMRIGAPVRLIVTGTINGKSFRLAGDDEEFIYACVVRVEAVEAGELVD